MVNGRLVTMKTKDVIYDEKYINSLHKSWRKSRWRPSYLSSCEYEFGAWEYNAQENKDFKCCKNSHYIHDEV